MITLKKKEPSWISYIKNRIKKKKNFLGFISGPTGSGKSWAGLSICLMLDPTFGPDRIVTNMRQLMKLINSGKLKGVGKAILWDECGVDASNKTWQSLTNRLINFLLQTFRHKQFVLMFTAPYLDFVDSTTRKMFHAELSTVSIDFKKKTTKLKPQLIQYNSRTKKFYYKYLRIRTENKRRLRLERWSVPKPPEWLITAYEQIKERFTDDLNISIEKQLDELENKKTIERKPLTKLQQQAMSLMGKYNDVNKVAKEMGVSVKTVYFHIAMAKKKNYKIEVLGE